MMARLRRLEERLTPREQTVTIKQWCAPDGQSCEPPAHVRAVVEQQTAGCWRVAAWAPESGCVVLLGEHDQVQVVEL